MRHGVRSCLIRELVMSLVTMLPRGAGPQAEAAESPKMPGMRHVALAVVLSCIPVSPAAAQQLEEAAKAAATMPRLHSLLVSWRGNLLLERYYNGARATRLANIKSASKS